MVSAPFTVSRVTIARLTAEHYVRRFWFVLVGIPLFGGFCVFWGASDAIRAFGALCLGWPLTIPLRAFLISARVARSLGRETVVRVENDEIRFVRPEGGGSKLPLPHLRTVTGLHGHYLLETERMAVALVPMAAFDGDAKARFEALLRKRAKIVRL